MKKRNIYKFVISYNDSGFRIVNMHPGDLAVAGCFYFYGFSGGCF